MKDLGILDSSMNSHSSQHSSSALYFGSGLAKGHLLAGGLTAGPGAMSAQSKEDDEDVHNFTSLFF